MARLHIYTVHVNPSLLHPYEAAEFVAEGFNWRAFVLSVPWMLYHRLWKAFFCLAAYNCALYYLLHSESFSPLGIGIIDIGAHMAIGWQANDWLRARLARRGYLTADITAGDSELRAEQRFFDRYFSTHAAA